jgi:hypothetical protein
MTLYENKKLLYIKSDGHRIGEAVHRMGEVLCNYVSDNGITRRELKET